MSHFKVSLLLLLSACFAMPLLATGADTKPKQPVATVDGQPIYDEDLAPSIEGQLQPLRNQEFEIKRKALDGLIEQKMLEAAAKKKGLTTEKLIEQEVNASISDPSDAELAKYGDRVRLSYRDFPLSAIHPQAMMAAEAARCALEQGKFWEYHDQLFAGSKLEKDVLIGYARDLKLDEKQFESCLSTEKYKADIEKDTQDARKAGVNGTPAFFINGVFLNGAKPKEEFISVIDDELARKSSHPTVSVNVSQVTR